MVTDPIYLKNWELFLDPKLSTSLWTNRTCKISNYVFHFIGLLIQHIYLKITCTRDQHVLQRPMRFKYYSEAAFVTRPTVFEITRLPTATFLTVKVVDIIVFLAKPGRGHAN